MQEYLPKKHYQRITEKIKREVSSGDIVIS